MNPCSLNRREAAAVLTAAGFPTTAATLEKLAGMRTGPAYRKYGSRVFYDRADLLAWGEAHTQRVAGATRWAARGAPHARARPLRA